MNKETYLRYLRAYLTNRLPAGEVEDILDYYTEYFEDAGTGRESEVMAELGSPEHLAQQILGERQQEGLVLRPEGQYGAADTPSPPVPTGRSGMPSWLFILILIAAAVFVGPPLAGTVLGLALAGVLCMIIGLIISVSGFGKFSLAGLLCHIGGGLITAAVGLLLLLGAVLVAWLTVKVLRWFRNTYGERRAGYEEGY